MKSHSVRSHVLVVCLIAAAATIAYHNAQATPFLFDSTRHIEDNAAIRTLSLDATLLSGSSRPITDFTFALNYHFSGLEPQSWHLVNTTIHVLAATALYFLLLITLRSQTLPAKIRRERQWLAAGIALVWTVHPLNTQAVTYVVQRSESMMGLSFFLFLLLYAVSSRTNSSWLPLTVAWLTFCFGLGCKQVMVTALPAAVLYHRAYLADSWSQSVKQRGWFWVLCVLPLLVAMVRFLPDLLDSDGGAGFGIRGVSSPEYARTQPQILLHYLRLLIWPIPLVLDYGWPVETETFVIAWTSGVVGLGLLALTVLFGRVPGWSFWGLAAVIVLLPTSSVLPLQDLAVEHRMYVPSAFIITLISMLTFVGGERIAGVRTVHWLICVYSLVVFAMGYLAIRRNEDYSSPIRMWTSVIAHTVDRGRENKFAGRAWCNLGNAYGDEEQWDESIRCLEQALTQELFPSKVHGNLTRAYLAVGELQQAKPHAVKALVAEPDSARVVQLSGLIAAAERDYPRAEDCFRKAVQLDSTDTVIQMNLARALEHQQKFDEAIETLQDVIRLDSRLVEARRRIVRLQLLTGRLDETVLSLRSWAKSFPDDSLVRFYEGEILWRQHQPKEAIATWEKLLADHPPPDLHFRLGNACRDVGDAAKAAAYYRAAIHRNSGHVEAMNNLGKLVAKENPGQALTYFEDAVRLAPEFPQARFNAAVLSAQQHDADTARRHLEELLLVSPDFTPAIDLLRTLNAGEAADEN